MQGLQRFHALNLDIEVRCLALLFMPVVFDSQGRLRRRACRVYCLHDVFEMTVEGLREIIVGHFGRGTERLVPCSKLIVDFCYFFKLFGSDTAADQNIIISTGIKFFIGTRMPIELR